MTLRVTLFMLAALALAACGQVESGASLDATPISALPTVAPATTTATANVAANAPTELPRPSTLPSATVALTASVPAATPAQPATAMPGLQPTFTSVPAGQSASSPDTVTHAQAALAISLGVAPQSLTLVQVEDQEWSDSSLGCPSPDQAYMQVIIAGQRIVFSDGANTYAVHTDGRGSRLIWCKGGKPVGLK